MCAFHGRTRNGVPPIFMGGPTSSKILMSFGIWDVSDSLLVSQAANTLTEWGKINESAESCSKNDPRSQCRSRKRENGTRQHETRVSRTVIQSYTGLWGGKI